ncbi:hypothetical protein FNH22_24735 [Fulvivirga sp. M361]|uniref:hypothetical protein n=1 Tax=Fulvivirga sp. M361 TaxID=2594266 RepID=UPI00117A46B4|nr:hypothetical protein [Fulvivirga sp. M361]TRX51202.1 hypothetical protein FNH22_24735 [Fulvivirga sp. M361]
MIHLFVRNKSVSTFTRVLALLMFTGLVFFSCGDDDTVTKKPLSNALNKIMPLGASRVEGARPEFESFRYELWKQLVDGDWDFDYIGTMTDDASYPGLSDIAFDPDHEGRGGFTAGEILSGINGWLENAGTPDIVLFSSPGGMMH